MDTRKKSVRLTIPSAQQVVPWILNGTTKQTRGHWKKRGVPWDVLGPILMDMVTEAAPARRLQHASDGPTLPAPDEDSVNDPTFRQVWAQIGAIWKHRKTTTSKQWEALVHNVDTFHDHLVLASRANRASGKSRIRPTKNVTRATTR